MMESESKKEQSSEDLGTRGSPLGFGDPAAMETGIAGNAHVAVGIFAGIGGLERGLATAGHETVLLCEIDAAASSVLKIRFPAIRQHRDVRTRTRLPKRVTVLTAGFTCQDLSQAGLNAGIAGSSSGLVNEVFRLLDNNPIPWVVLENVPFMLHLARGRAMERIATAFEERGYKWAYRVVDSRSFGLPQRRRRVYFVATRGGDPRNVFFADEA